MLTARVHTQQHRVNTALPSVSLQFRSSTNCRAQRQNGFKFDFETETADGASDTIKQEQ